MGTHDCKDHFEADKSPDYFGKYGQDMELQGSCTECGEEMILYYKLEKFYFPRTHRREGVYEIGSCNYEIAEEV